jgi:hypothetical protein
MRSVFGLVVKQKKILCDFKVFGCILTFAKFSILIPLSATNTHTDG